MSNREICISLIDRLDETQLENITSIVKSFVNAIEEARDDAFCFKLIEKYENNPSKNDTISFEEAIRKAGFSIEEIQN